MAIETKTNGTGTTYLQIDFGRKSMYIYSGEEKEGFEKHVTSSGKVSYRQYVNAVSGKITGAYFRDGNFGGQEFVIIFTDNDDRYAVQMGIEESVFSSLARSINNIDTNKVVRLSIYESKSKTNDKSYFGLSLSYPLELDENEKAKLIEWGDELPKGKQLRNGKWDFSQMQDEAYGRVEDFIKKNNFDKFEAKESQEPKKENTKPSNTEPDVDEEDLPF